MAAYRTLAEIESLELTPAERELMRVCRLGAWAEIGDVVPGPDETARSIRAGVIRYLALGGCADYRPHEKGVRVRGALVPDALDLQACACDSDLWLAVCHLVKRVNLRGAQLATLSLEGSHCASVAAERLTTSGSVFMNRNFRAMNGVVLKSAEIGGSLHLTKGAFLECGRRRRALSASRIRVGGSVFMREGFRAGGMVRLAGAQIANDLACRDARFSNEGGVALDLSKANIGGAFYWHGGSVAEGALDLKRAQCRALHDSEDSWPQEEERLFLNGFTYDVITGGLLDAETRLKWLTRGDRPKGGGAFWPQPYVQIAGALRAMGHDDDARIVMVEKERRLRASFRRLLARRARGRGAAGKVWLGLRRLVSWVLQHVLDVIVGFGYRPAKALYALCALMLAGALLFHATWSAGDFAPNSALVQNSAGWAEALSAGNPAAAWSAPDGAGRDYETFHPVAYAFDVVVPVIDIGQEEAWGPSTTRSPLGWHAWWARWVLKILGWVVSAVGAAAITGIIRQE